MNVRDIQGLRSIMGFEGDYAVFKAKDSEGIYQGVINRKGEIVWDAKLFPPTLHMHGTNIYMSCVRGKKGLHYYDVALQQYVEKPERKIEGRDSYEDMKELDAKWVEKEGSIFSEVGRLTDNLLKFRTDKIEEIYGIMTEDGKILIEPQYKYIIPNNDSANHFVVVLPNDMYGIIDLKGNTTLPFEYEHLFFRGNFYVARKDGKAGIIDLEGNILIPFDYEALHPSYDEGLDLISAKKDGEFIFINAKQERVELF